MLYAQKLYMCTSTRPEQLRAIVVWYILDNESSVVYIRQRRSFVDFRPDFRPDDVEKIFNYLLPI
jgi:hypothetical protein